MVGGVVNLWDFSHCVLFKIIYGFAVTNPNKSVVWLKFKQYIKSNQTSKEIYLRFDPFSHKPTNNFYGFQSFITCFFNYSFDLTSLKKYEGFS